MTTQPGSAHAWARGRVRMIRVGPARRRILKKSHQQLMEASGGGAVSSSPRNRINGTEFTFKPPLTLINDASVIDDGSLRLQCIVLRPSAAVSFSPPGAGGFDLAVPGIVINLGTLRQRANARRGGDAVFLCRKSPLNFVFTMQARARMIWREAQYPEAACQQKSISPSSR